MLHSANMRIVSRRYWEHGASRLLVSFAFCALCLFDATVQSARARPQHAVTMLQAMFPANFWNAQFHCGKE